MMTIITYDYVSWYFAIGMAETNERLIHKCMKHSISFNLCICNEMEKLKVIGKVVFNELGNRLND